jgi:hypothetical protein
VVVAAKFGGEFKIIHTMRKSKTSSIDTFSQQSIEDTMKMFSRGWSMGTNLKILSNTVKASKSSNETSSEEKKLEKEKSKK